MSRAPFQMVVLQVHCLSVDNAFYSYIIAVRLKGIRTREKQLAEYRKKFIEQPYLEIVFERKRISFDARYLVTLDDKGIVYPTAEASDNWGTLTVSSGGLLISPDRTKGVLSAPLKITEETVQGDGWTLRLNKGYIVEKMQNTAAYRLVKK